MRAITYDRFGPAEVLNLADVPVPEARPGDLLVRVEAAGVNRADLLQRTGAYGEQSFGESALLGLEVAGKVVAIGFDVQDVAVGDHVMAIVGGGGYAEFARVDHRMAVRIPGGLTFVEAAAVMESFVTACEAAVHLAGLQRGQSVLVHAAAGGIGSACVQVAHALGAIVYATAGSARIADVRRLGAADVIDHRAEDFERAVLASTDGRGVEAVIDFVGGDYLKSNIRCLSPGGTLVQVGILSGEKDATLPLDLLLHRHLRVIGTVMKSRNAEEKSAMIRRFADKMLPYFVSARLRPIVDTVFPLEHAADAHRQMERGGGFGKVVLKM